MIKWLVNVCVLNLKCDAVLVRRQPTTAWRGMGKMPKNPDDFILDAGEWFSFSFVLVLVLVFSFVPVALPLKGRTPWYD
jgi:hypothetical protein